MKKVILSVLALVSLSLAAPAMAGNCDHASDTASDGSNCGGRAADQRPGGK